MLLGSAVDNDGGTTHTKKYRELSHDFEVVAYDATTGVLKFLMIGYEGYVSCS